MSLNTSYLVNNWWQLFILSTSTFIIPGLYVVCTTKKPVAQITFVHLGIRQRIQTFYGVGLLAFLTLF